MSGALIPVAGGEVAAVVTYLAMDAPPASLEAPPSPLALRRWDRVDPDAYRALFRDVGGPWLWFSRLAMDEATLRRALGEVHVVEDEAGERVGLVELDFREAGIGLLRFLGLLPALAGRGHGRWLLAQALRLLWRPGVRQVRVHTCSLDHPAALPSYLRAGFVAHARALETFPDPRLAGLLPRDAAPQVPMIEP